MEQNENNEINEIEDLEIGIPRQVISLKSSSRNLRMFSCVLILHNILFINGISLLSFSFEEFVGYLVVQLFSPVGIVYYFCMSFISMIYRLCFLSNFMYMNMTPSYFMMYTLSLLLLKLIFILNLLIFRNRIIQLDFNSLVIVRNIRYI